MTNITFANPVYIDVYNRDMAIKMPTLRLVDCKFAGNIDIASAGLNPGSINKIRVENDHVEDDRCTLNSTGQVIMKGNVFNFVNTGDVELRGGDMLKYGIWDIDWKCFG